MSDSSGRRRERRARQDAARHVAMQPISYRPPPFDLLTPEEIERLHQAALRILGEYGIDFYDDDVWGSNWVGHLIPYAGAVTYLTLRIFAHSPLSLKAVTSKHYSGCYQSESISDT